ncbi:PspC domain-containing protein [Mucilaginibacter pallidiroseus]|uniref:PspC domain-containing protein n=1 Tax=Mucilaginibacter pallidiroseus TaxID=2599295 RepID=A0A563UEL6_9SPHI|nr:PspC domain-containing protein [Mucilaginibacter pallidiroseus]TWR29801.1 PspC domain-containing protein [Mucilaginibacter pallidiroseus]
MNKTIIININGIVFHIEENAYEILKGYMSEVQRHFMNSADSLEITTDIENRIAEMFNEILLKEGKQVIIEQDVKNVVEQMGSVKDFEAAENDEAPGAQSAFQAYNTGARRLFRDPDDHLVAGVCSGIANYFDFNSVWVRLLFVFLIPFGGFGFLVYVILWIVVPKAITRADRMAMKGQKLDLQGFKINFEEEMSTMRNNLSNLSTEARPFIYKTRDFAGDFFGHFGTFLGGTGKLIGKLIAICILVACLGSIIALVAGVVLALVYNENMGIYHLFPFNITSNEVNKIFFVSAILLAIIPLLAIILLILRWVFNTRSVSRTIGSTLLLTWVAALCVVIYYSAKISSEFRTKAGFSQTINIQPAADSTYYLRLNDIKFLTGEDSTRLKIRERFNGRIILDDDDDNNMDMPDKNIDIYIEKSDVAQPVLVESFSARGRNYEDALFNARGTSYQFKQEGNILKFNRRLEKQDDRYWRSQSLKLTLKIPLNYKVVIDGGVDRFVRDVDVWQCKDVNKKDDASQVKFIMTDNGLQCKVDTLVLPLVEPKPDTTALTTEEN